MGGWKEREGFPRVRCLLSAEGKSRMGKDKVDGIDRVPDKMCLDEDSQRIHWA